MNFISFHRTIFEILCEPEKASSAPQYPPGFKIFVCVAYVLTKIEKKAKKKLAESRQFCCLSGLARVVKAPKCLFDSRKLIEITSSPLLTNICAIKGTELSRPLDFEYLGYFWNNFFVICSIAFLILKDYYAYDIFLEA